MNDRSLTDQIITKESVHNIICPEFLSSGWTFDKSTLLKATTAEDDKPISIFYKAKELPDGCKLKYSIIPVDKNEAEGSPLKDGEVKIENNGLAIVDWTTPKQAWYVDPFVTKVFTCKVQLVKSDGVTLHEYTFNKLTVT